MKDGKISSHQQVDVVEIMKKIRQNAAKNRAEITSDERTRREAKSELVTLLQNAQVPDVIADQIRQQSVFDTYDPRTLYFSSRAGVVGRIIGWIRMLLRPITKLFFNLDPLAHEVHRLTVLNNFYLRTIQDLVMKTSSLRVDVYSMKKRSAHHRSNDDRHSRFNNHHNHRRYGRSDRHRRDSADTRNSAAVGGRNSSSGSDEPTA